MQGRYEDALATYLDLYIQSDGRPEYLRNIGRCQQKLKQYPRAVESFKEYLRRGKHLSADERKEVQGFISEMEAEMKAPPAASDGTTPAPAPVKTAPPPAATPVFTPAPRPTPELAPAPPPPAPYAQQPPPSYGPPASGPAPAQNPPVAYNGGAPMQPSLAAPAPAPAPPDLVAHGPDTSASTAHTSPLRVVGIVSLVAAAAGAVGGTVALLEARSTFNQAKDAGCPTGSSTYCNGEASSVSSDNTLSKILYIGAGVLGVAGITMVVVAPSATPEGRVSLAVSGRF